MNRLVSFYKQKFFDTAPKQLMKDIFNMDIVNSEVLDDGDGDCYSARRFYKLAS